MTSSQDPLGLVEEAVAHVDQALAALGQLPKTGDHAVTVDGIVHELHGLAERLRALLDDVAGEANRH